MDCLLGYTAARKRFQTNQPVVLMRRPMREMMVLLWSSRTLQSESQRLRLLQ
jgi:hypothetical protein